MKTFCHLIGKYFGIIAIVFLILGMTIPDSFKWVVGNLSGIPVLSTLLGVIMFGMGTTLNLRDFALVLKRPLDVFCRRLRPISYHAFAGFFTGDGLQS
ncbi:MAG: hypothetical protein LUH17_10075 [Acidaminococcaceae bacterium]|nr:hypothetical protein [Acidaminococcaceae bacterium]